MDKSKPTKSIGVIYTGGTFGMKKGDKGLTPLPRKDVVEKLKRYPILHEEQRKDVVEKLHEEQKLEDSFTLTLPDMEVFGQVLRVIYTVDELPGGKHLDSSNMKPEDWKTIANEIEQKYTRYDGFVVIMGTDTMTYTASGLSFLMTNLTKPVVITGAQIPIFETRTDGVDNLLCALITATSNVPEVMICFDKKAYRGNRTVKIDCDGFSAFYSPNMDPLVTLDVRMAVNASLTTPLSPASSSKIEELHIADSHTSDEVGILFLHPGIKSDKIKYSLAGLKAVVLMTFGSGNAPCDTVEFLKEAAKSVIVVNVTQCHKGSVSSAYEVGQALGTDIISGGDMTTEAAFAKLLYVLGMKEKDLKAKKEEIGKPLRGEMTDPNAKSSNNN